jgi:hypothetical protein
MGINSWDLINFIAGEYTLSLSACFFFFFFWWMAEECVDIWNTYFKLYLIYIIGTVSYCLDLLL